MICIMRKPTMWFLDRPDTNGAVQSQKQARGWKFWIKKVKEHSENKGADQLGSSHMQNVGFLMAWLICLTLWVG